MDNSSRRRRAPFFSVVIPTLNEEKYLPTLLTSLSKQTFREFETIVVDGSSEDATVKLAEQFSRKLPALSIVTQRRRNLAHQRNVGAQKAVGKYLIFFDADVSFDPLFLSKIYAQLIEATVPFATTFLEPDTKKVDGKLITLFFNISIVFEKFIGKPYVQGGNTIVRRDIFLNVGGYDDTVLVSEDQEFALRLHKNRITLTILNDPKLVFSLRRFRSQGVLSVAREQISAHLYTMIFGKIPSDATDYKMGGHVHENIKKKDTFFSPSASFGKMQKALQKTFPQDK